MDATLHPFLAGPTPVAIAHRGGAEEAPENTLEAFETAVALGYRHLETDAHVSRDGIVVAFHDHRLDAITDRQGEVAELTIAEIEAADAGWTFSPDGGRTFPFRERGVRIARLEELLLRWPHVRVNIDPKADVRRTPLSGGPFWPTWKPRRPTGPSNARRHLPHPVGDGTRRPKAAGGRHPRSSWSWRCSAYSSSSTTGLTRR